MYPLCFGRSQQLMADITYVSWSSTQRFKAHSDYWIQTLAPYNGIQSEVGLCNKMRLPLAIIL